MEIVYEDYMIKPLWNGLSWEVFKNKTVKSAKNGERKTWVSLGKYPDTLGSALATIFEMEMKTTKGTKNLSETVIFVKKLHADLLSIGLKAREALEAGPMRITIERVDK